MRIAITVAVALLTPLLTPIAGAQQRPAPEKTLTDKDKADEGEKAITAMRDVLTEVNKLVEEARGERDALRLNCVNERKSQISGLVKVAELALQELRAAGKERQSEAVDHEYTKIQIARSKVDGYRTEANQCIGLLAFYTSDTVERQFTDENKDTPGLDPTRPVPLEPTPFRPPPASPIR